MVYNLVRTTFNGPHKPITKMDRQHVGKGYIVNRLSILQTYTTEVHHKPMTAQRQIPRFTKVTLQTSATGKQETGKTQKEGPNVLYTLHNEHPTGDPFGMQIADPESQAPTSTFLNKLFQGVRRI